jgi:dGTP triphosphohydrolase
MQAGFAQRVAASHGDAVERDVAASVEAGVDESVGAGGRTRVSTVVSTVVGTGDDAVRARVVADYIAGMTDRFATREHARLTGVQVAL